MKKSIYTRQYALFLELLRDTREQAGLTQQAIAAKLNATQSFVSKCERGERRLDVVELRTWCAALGLDMLDFVTCFEAACINDSTVSQIL